MIRFKDIQWHKNKYEILTRSKEFIELKVFDVNTHQLQNLDIRIKVHRPVNESFMIFKNKTQNWEDYTPITPIGDYIIVAHSKNDHKTCSIHSETSLGRLAWGFGCESYEIAVDEN